MTHHLKVLGLALAAVFALSAMTAAAVSAQPGMITSDGPVFLDGTDKGEPSSRPLTAFGGKIECETGHYTGGKVEGTTEAGHHEALTSGSSDFTLTPVYTNCTSQSGLPETVTMNGCDYEFEILPTGGKEYKTTSNLICPEGKEVTIHIYASHFAHTAGIAACTIHIPQQTGLGGGEIEDEGNGHLTLGGEIKEITMTLTGEPCGGPFTIHDAVLDLSVTLSGTDAATEGTETPLSLSHN